MNNSTQERLNRAAMPGNYGCQKCNEDRHPCWTCGAPVGHSDSFCSKSCADTYELALTS